MNIKSQKWKDRFIDLATHISAWSKDPSTQVGAVLVNNSGNIISVGYNGFARGKDDSILSYGECDRHYRLLYTIHAEINCLANQVLINTDQDLHMFVSHPMCNECAKAVSAYPNIKSVTWPENPEFSIKWNSDTTIEYLNKCGITVFVKPKHRI